MNKLPTDIKIHILEDIISINESTYLFLENYVTLPIHSRIIHNRILQEINRIYKIKSLKNNLLQSSYNTR